MRVLCLLSLFLLLCSCVVTGTKTVFVPYAESSWVYSGERYRFSCEDLFIDFAEIREANSIAAYGPLLPILPSESESSAANNTLKIHLQVYLFKHNDKVLAEDKFQIDVHSSGEKLILKSSTTYNVPDSSSENYWGYMYGLEYDRKFLDLNNLRITVTPQFNTCTIPELALAKEDVEYSKLILSPGP